MSPPPPVYPTLHVCMCSCAYSFDDPIPNMLCVGQCEYSFSKTHVIMEMNKKMEVYGYVSWVEGVDSGRSPSLAHACIFKLLLIEIYGI